MGQMEQIAFKRWKINAATIAALTRTRKRQNEKIAEKNKTYHCPPFFKEETTITTHIHAKGCQKITLTQNFNKIELGHHTNRVNGLQVVHPF